MERQKIFPVLFAVLLAAAIFLGVYFFITYRNINYLPEEALDNMCDILEADGIFLDRDIVPLKKEKGTVYVCAAPDYGSTVAVQLGESEIKYHFALPEGEIILLQNGGFYEFGEDFSFLYRADRTVSYSSGALEDDASSPVRIEEAEKECRTAKEFLEKGSSGFDKQEQLKLATAVTGVSEKDGVFYVECIRTIDGHEITGNRVVCAIKDGIVAEAVGVWSFLSFGEAYSSQLADIFNILFSVKKEIAQRRESESIPAVTVEAVERCHTLVLSGGSSGLCFIPCWRIVTDVCGIFVYNALDGVLCTE